MRKFENPLEGMQFPNVEQLKDPLWVFQNRDKIKYQLEQLELAAVRIDEIRSGLSDIPHLYMTRDLLQDSQSGAWYSFNWDNDRGNWCSLCRERTADVYLNAHNNTTYGVRLCRPSELPGCGRDEEYLGAHFTEEEAKQMATDWVCQGIKP